MAPCDYSMFRALTEETMKDALFTALGILSAVSLVIAVSLIPSPSYAQHAGQGKDPSPKTLRQCIGIRDQCHDFCRLGVGQSPAGSPFTAYLLQCNVNCEAAFRSCRAHLNVRPQ